MISQECILKVKGKSEYHEKEGIEYHSKEMEHEVEQGVKDGLLGITKIGAGVAATAAGRPEVGLPLMADGIADVDNAVDHFKEASRINKEE